MWIFNNAQGVGLKHIPSKIPCQDATYVLQKNGINIIALSDGCGSSKISQFGSQLITKEICEFVADNFNTLCTSDKIISTKMIVDHLIDKLNSFIVFAVSMGFPSHCVILHIVYHKTD